MNVDRALGVRIVNEKNARDNVIIWWRSLEDTSDGMMRDEMSLSLIIILGRRREVMLHR
jgi:hypothetical protein